MYQSLLKDSTFIANELLEIDQRIAKNTQNGDCLICRSPLHVANFPRKVRSGAFDFGTEHDIRFSFCCAKCRKRHTPPSLRFFGRCIYTSAVVIAFALIFAVIEKKLSLIAKMLGPNRRTLKRWHEKLENLPKTKIGRLLQARFCEPVTTDTLAQFIINGPSSEMAARLIKICKALAHLSGSSSLFDKNIFYAEFAQ